MQQRIGTTSLHGRPRRNRRIGGREGATANPPVIRRRGKVVEGERYIAKPNILESLFSYWRAA